MPENIPNQQPDIINKIPEPPTPEIEAVSPDQLELADGSPLSGEIVTIAGDDAVAWAKEKGLSDGRFYVPRSNGETDYGGWNISRVDSDSTGRVVIWVTKPSPDGNGYLDKSLPAIALLESQETPSGRINVKAFKAADELRQKLSTKSVPEPTTGNSEALQGLGIESELATDLLLYEVFRPHEKITASGREFRVSLPIEAKGRQLAVLYAQKDGQLVPRLAYKSNSAGDWRIAYRVEEAGRRYAKEASKHGHFHYTQGNKLHDDIAAKLDELSDKKFDDTADHTVDFLVSKFYDTNPAANSIDTAEQEIIYDQRAKQLLEKFSHYISAGLLAKEDVVEITKKYGSVGAYFDSLDIEFDKVPGFMPDFEQNPIYSKKSDPSNTRKLSS